MRYLIAFSVVLAFAAGCCTNATLNTQVTLYEVQAKAFVDRMGSGQTTREEEQAFIREEAKAFEAIRKALLLEDPLSGAAAK